MKKSRKILIRIVISLVTLFVLVLVFLAIFFPMDEMRSYVISMGEEKLNRKIEIDDMTLSIWGGFGVRLVNFKLSNSSPADTLSQGNLLVADDIDLKLSLLPLLTGKYKIDRLIINNPDIEMLIAEDGSSNFDFSSPDSSTVEEISRLPIEAQAAGVAISFDKFEISNGRIYYSNRQTKSEFSVSGLNVVSTLDDLDNNAYSSSGEIQISELSQSDISILKTIPLSLSYEMEFLVNEQILNIKKAELTSGTAKIEFGGKLVRKNRNLTANLLAVTKNTKISDILLLLSNSSTEKLKDFSLTGLVSSEIDIEYDANNVIPLKYDGEIKIVSVILNHRELKASLDIPEVSVIIENDNLRLNSRNGQFNYKPFGFHLSIRDFKNPKVTGEIAGNIDLIFIEPFLPPSNNHKLSGDASFDLKISGSAGNPADLNYYGNVNLSNGKYNSKFLLQPLRLVEGSFYLEKNLLRVDSLTIKTDSNLVKFSGRISNLSDYLMADSFSQSDNHFIVDGNLKGNLKLGSFSYLLPDKGNPRLDGDLDFDIDISGKSSIPEKVIRNGRISFSNVSYNDDLLNEPLKKFDAEMTITPDTINIKKMTAIFASGDLSFNGKLANPFPYLLPFRDIDRSNMQKPDFSFTLSSHRLDIDKLFPEAVPGQVEDSMPKTPDSLSVILLPDISGKGRFTIDTLIYAGVEFSNISGDMKIYNRIIDCSNVSGKAYTGDISGSTVIDFNDPNSPVYSGTFRAKQIEANDFLTRFTPLGGYLSGKIDCEGNYNSTGWEKKTFINSLSMKSSLDVLEGELSISGNILKAIQQFASKINEPIANKHQIKRLRTKVEIKDGNVIVNDLSAKVGDLGNIWLNGSYSFSNDVSFTGTLELSTTMTEKIISKSRLLGDIGTLFGRNAIDRIKLPIKISGTVTEPKLTIDLNLLGNNGEDKLKEKAKDFLKNLID